MLNSIEVVPMHVCEVIKLLHDPLQPNPYPAAPMVDSCNGSYTLCAAFPPQSGWSALMFACDKGHPAVVAELLSHGANIGYCSQQVYKCVYSYDSAPIIYFPFQSGLSSLMIATNKGHHEVVKLLLEAGAPVDYTEKVNLKLLLPHYV